MKGGKSRETKQEIVFRWKTVLPLWPCARLPFPVFHFLLSYRNYPRETDSRAAHENFSGTRSRGPVPDNWQFHRSDFTRSNRCLDATNICERFIINPVYGPRCVFGSSVAGKNICRAVFLNSLLDRKNTSGIKELWYVK